MFTWIWGKVSGALGWFKGLFLALPTWFVTQIAAIFAVFVTCMWDLGNALWTEALNGVSYLWDAFFDWLGTITIWTVQYLKDNGVDLQAAFDKMNEGWTTIKPHAQAAAWLFPIKEILVVFVACWGVLVTIRIVRWVKSCIPTVSGG